jgi:DNA-binding transcriptional regulator YhcF (GntR family)
MTKGPSVSIDVNSPLPVYRQIADSVRHLLVEGELQPGEQLPPIRQLALDLSINFNTVAQAYRILADEGWVELKRKRGATVLNRRQPAAPAKARRQQLLQRLRELTAQLRAEGVPSREIASHLEALAAEIKESIIPRRIEEK